MAEPSRKGGDQRDEGMGKDRKIEVHAASCCYGLVQAYV
jgi:hypothetical protein